MVVVVLQFMLMQAHGFCNHLVVVGVVVVVDVLVVVGVVAMVVVGIMAKVVVMGGGGGGIAAIDVLQLL